MNRSRNTPKDSSTTKVGIRRLWDYLFEGNPARILAEDLRVSWSWPHFAFFLLFWVFCSAPIRFLAFIILRSTTSHRNLTLEEFHTISTLQPRLSAGIYITWSVTIILFLYITLAVLRDAPFWATLGWKKSASTSSIGVNNPWFYFFTGSGVAVCTSFLNAQLHSPQELVNQVSSTTSSSILLFAVQALLVAPFFEETIFRGYLYPLFAKSAGVWLSIMFTGALFGLMHGSILDWDWRRVFIFVLVGIVFTFVRAKTGTVLCSFLLHLGYNSVLVFASFFAARSVTQFLPYT